MTPEQYLTQVRRSRISYGCLAKAPVLHSMNSQDTKINELLINILINSVIRNSNNKI